MELFKTTTTKFKIDNEMSSWEFKYGYYRIILSDESSPVVKYLAYHDPVNSFPDIRGERLDFNTVPDGNWNIGYLKRNLIGEKYTLDYTDNSALAAVKNLWHSSKIDYEALSKPLEHDGPDLQCAAQIYSTIHDGSQFSVAKVIVNIEWCPESVYGSDYETNMYSLIEKHGIAPKFVAYITESNERTIGFMIEKINARHATHDDLSACRLVLSKLHRLGIAHGSPQTLRDSDFLITNDDDGTRALLQNFAGSFQTNDEAVFDEEMNRLEGILTTATSELGSPPKGLGLELSEEIRAISLRDEGLYPLVWEQAVQEGKITVTQEEHKEMLTDLRKNGWKAPVNA